MVKIALPCKLSVLALSSAVLAASVVTAPASAGQANFTPPDSCVYGRDRNSWSLNEVRVEVELDYNQQPPEESEEEQELLEKLVELLKVTIESLDYLRIESPKHVLQGSTFRAKGNLFDRFAYVRFHNSDSGYVGKDKSNLDGNSYLNMSFPEEHGVGLVWITRGDNSQCSMSSVYVQKRPSITGSDIDTGYRRLDLSVGYAVDEYSLAAVDSSEYVQVKFDILDLITNVTTTRQMASSDKVGTLSLSHYPEFGGGLYQVSVTVDDGNFITSKNLGTFDVPGGHTGGFIGL